MVKPGWAVWKLTEGSCLVYSSKFEMLSWSSLRVPSTVTAIGHVLEIFFALGRGDDDLGLVDPLAVLGAPDRAGGGAVTSVGVGVRSPATDR